MNKNKNFQKVNSGLNKPYYIKDILYIYLNLKLF